MSTITSFQADGKFRTIVKGRANQPAIEIAFARNRRSVCVRYSEDPSNAITVSTTAWQEFVRGVKAGEFARKVGKT